MVLIRVRTHLLGVALLALVLSACAKSSINPAAGNSPSSAPSSAMSHEVSIGTGSAASVGKVLTDSQGLTLYLNTQEQGGQDSCTGGCATLRPPVSIASGGPWTVAPGSNAQKSMIGTASYGGQRVVTYGGYPLHTYTGDTAAGQANGQGLGGIWFAMTSSGTAAGGGGSGRGSGGGGY